MLAYALREVKHFSPNDCSGQPLPWSVDAVPTCWGVEAPSAELSWLSPPLGCCCAWLARVCSSVAAGVVLLEAFPASLRIAACTAGVQAILIVSICLCFATGGNKAVFDSD